ncbi:hypothetical protein AALP_AA5G150500 [Arabis alpina]|uniref:Uncharacterized protein n=1 Tax=Arabis alpina TaxID=50452 RepID=A0A087GX74_ARAAL|nr:hypothetical protein AALP_AA5G150500 [Arabis alpina]
MAGTTDVSDSPPFTLPPLVTNLFPFLKPKAPVSGNDVSVTRPKDVSGEKEAQNSSYDTVSFPYNPPTNAEPLKVEAEPSSGKTSNPLIIWQVYALGGFLVLKWAWARWNERKATDKDDQENDDGQPSGGQA